MNRLNKGLVAKIALFGASIIWGGSFIFVKSSMDFMQPHVLLAYRFTIGVLLLAAIFYKSLRKLNREYLVKGGALGLCLFLAYSIQTIGIINTTPGKNAFLTAVYCVIVPFLNWGVEKKRPDFFHVIAALFSIIGIGLVSINGDFSIGIGDTLTLISGIFYAAHMVGLAKISRDKDPVLLTILQFGFAAVFSWIIALLFEDFPTYWPMEAINGLIYLAVFATAGALLLQNIGQKYTNPAPASIILSLEAVFGVIFSVMFYGEELTVKLCFGFLLIFIAILVSETKLGFHKRTNKEDNNSNQPETSELVDIT